MIGRAIPGECTELLQIDDLLREDLVELSDFALVHASLNFIKLILLVLTLA